MHEVFDIIEKVQGGRKVFTDDANVVRVLVGLSTLCDAQAPQESRVYERDLEGDFVAEALSDDSRLASARSVRSPLEGHDTLVAGSEASTFEFDIRRTDRLLTAEEGDDALVLAAGFELRFLQVQPNCNATLCLIDSQGLELIAA